MPAFSTFTSGSGRKISDEQRAKLEASLMFPAKTNGKHQERNASIQGNLPPQNYVKRRLKRDWDPVPSFDIDWYKRQHMNTAEQEAFLEKFDRDVADERYINRPAPAAPPPTLSQGEGLHRTDDDVHPMGPNGKLHDTFSESPKVNRARDDMWREQARYESEFGAETHSNRFQVNGRDRPSGWSQAQRQWSGPAGKEPSFTDHSAQDNVPEDYRGPVERLAASGQSKALLDEIEMRGEDSSAVAVRRLRPYAETNGRGMNSGRDPAEVLYATRTGALGMVAGDGAPTPQRPTTAGAICRTSRGAYEGAMAMNPWEPLRPRAPGCDMTFAAPGMYPMAHPRAMAYALPPSPFAMPLNCGRTVGY